MPLGPWQILRKVKIQSPNDAASCPRRLKWIILFTVTSKLALGPTQPDSMGTGGSFLCVNSQGVKLTTQHPGTNEWSYTLLPPVRLHGTDRDNCTFNCAFLCYNIAQSGRWGSVCWRNRLSSSSKQKCTQKLIKWLLTSCIVLTHLPSCCSYNRTGT